VDREGPQFVDKIRHERSGWPVFANLRNGLWYGKRFSGTCYFKSTDGHVGTWAFSKSRLNLHIASSASAHGGCIVVDSTRRGKVTLCIVEFN
jgi:tRNA A64-2'-O-ribosylphosphate transferase